MWRKKTIKMFSTVSKLARTRWTCLWLTQKPLRIVKRMKLKLTPDLPRRNTREIQTGTMVKVCKNFVWKHDFIVLQFVLSILIYLLVRKRKCPQTLLILIILLKVWNFIRLLNQFALSYCLFFTLYELKIKKHTKKQLQQKESQVLCTDNKH